MDIVFLIKNILFSFVKIKMKYLLPNFEQNLIFLRGFCKFLQFSLNVLVISINKILNIFALF